MSLEPIISLQSQQDVDKCVDCPLCMEALDYDDLGFFPCSCGYQVCRFCWHRLKNDENGLCPACRQLYPDSPIQFSTISIEAVEELKKRKKKQKEKQKLKDVAKSQNLSSVRVVQKNLLFVIGLPQRLSQEDLRKEFSKYGKILKMVINASSAYVTYTRPEDAVAAIKSLNDSSYNNVNKNGIRTNTTPILRASLGTTKYCTHWLRSQTCPKQPDCMYLHEMAEPEASFTKEEMQLGKHTEYEKRLIHYYLDLLSKEREKKKLELISCEKSSDNKCNNKSFLINNNRKILANNREFAIESNGCNNGCDETSSDSLLNGESDTERSVPQSTPSPLLPCRWGTSLNRSNCSSNSESNSNSLSSTPNNTLVTNDTLSSSSTTTTAQQSTKNGELINNIDDNAVDTSIITSADDINNGIDDDSDDMTADDDGLDFDPISISSRGLQDLLRDCNSELICINTSNDLNLIIHKFGVNQVQQQFNTNKPVIHFNNRESVQNQGQQHQQQLQQQSHQWQQQQNSLRQLLPNVNITFQHQNNSNNSSGFVNGLRDSSQPVFNNTHIRQQQPIGHQMPISGQLIGHPVMSSAANVSANGVNCVPQYWNQTQQQQQHILRLQQHQQQQQLQRQQQFSQRFFMPTIGSMSGRQPPPGF
jgi:CCR4-NOT transcription complex subunit 4